MHPKGSTLLLLLLLLLLPSSTSSARHGTSTDKRAKAPVMSPCASKMMGDDDDAQWMQCQQPHTSDAAAAGPETRGKAPKKHTVSCQSYANVVPSLVTLLLHRHG
ncbi:hypothetical protein BC567DRAFT_210340 [Phyllosticta citribraziliensis]